MSSTGGVSRFASSFLRRRRRPVRYDKTNRTPPRKIPRHGSIQYIGGPRRFGGSHILFLLLRPSSFFDFDFFRVATMPLLPRTTAEPGSGPISFVPTTTPIPSLSGSTAPAARSASAAATTASPTKASSAIAEGAIAAVVVIAIGLLGIGGFFVWRRWMRGRRALDADGDDDDDDATLAASSTRSSLLRRKSTFFDRGLPADDEDSSLWDGSAEKAPPVPRIPRKYQHQRRHGSGGSASVPLMDDAASVAGFSGNHHRAGSDPDFVFGAAPQVGDSRLRSKSSSPRPSRPRRPAIDPGLELVDLPVLGPTDEARVPLVPLRTVGAARQASIESPQDTVVIAPSVAVVGVQPLDLRAKKQNHNRGRSSVDLDLPPMILPLGPGKTSNRQTMPVSPRDDEDDEEFEDEVPSGTGTNTGTGAYLSRFLSYYLTRKPTAAPARKPSKLMAIPATPTPTATATTPSPSPSFLDAYYAHLDDVVRGRPHPQPRSPAETSNRLTRFLSYYLSPEQKARKATMIQKQRV
ncbi:hypothetical protein HMN09_00839200 [Mycena chlorophos]|uniref:Uncharacterized protein n=1 Tax=Mycena chlorophos TaxID=658473 RepID=A0A8H6ST16_MYCCL|nr:hypothetical protein HMN09_00839200 [Mycena chlorophos]